MSKDRIARVVIDRALDREFDYEIPEQLRDTICVGAQVDVPFGRGRGGHARGFVVGFKAESEFDTLKKIDRMVGRGPLISEPVLRLARWMADYYVAPIEHALRTVLPGAVRKKGAGFKERLRVKLERELSGLELETLRLKAKKQAAIYDALAVESPLLMTDLVASTGVTSGTVRAMEKKGLISITNETVLRDPHAGDEILPTEHLRLNDEQARALNLVKDAVDGGDPSVVLLFGVTGSGKTEVYLQGIQYAMDHGRGAIVLVPEISLTPQTVERFRSRFGDRIAILHSHLSEGERHDEWHRIREGDADIVVGARSALFAPVHDLGLIVVDEEHEPSYKQDESPRYNARDVAVMRGHLEGCAVVLGSATPSVESYHNVLRSKYAQAPLTQRVDDQRMPHIRVVDMKMEAQREGGARMFSKDLVEAVRNRLELNEQSILFLNRRGFSTSLICPDCGYVAECTMCSVSMTYHRGADELRCHICGEVSKVPPRCPDPDCRSDKFKYAGMGTEKIEDLAAKVFKGARIQRADSDTMTSKDAYRNLMGDFRGGKIDILIGTQMIAKGLHFPNVTLVGVVNADSTLHMPEFRAAERTFQLVTQVAGRAGRGDVRGEVIVQTYTPFHPAIQAARRLAYEEFFDQELEFRREMFYPPFAHMVCLTFRSLQEELVALTTLQFKRAWEKHLDMEKVRVSDPVQAPIARAKGFYRYQLIARAVNTTTMTHPLRVALHEFKMPDKVKWAADIDPVNTM